MKSLSRFRRAYLGRLVFRIVIFLSLILLNVYRPQDFEIVLGWNMLREINVLDLVWLIWMGDMVLQLCKVPRYWPLGSQKFWKERFVADERFPSARSVDLIKDRRDVIRIAIAWILFVGAIDLLYLYRIISYRIIVLACGFFYVCDLICVLFWCPFRVFFMRNKCCTTCRIFNWDHAMMFLPLIVLPGLWSWSLLGLSLIILLVWEITYHRYPERFYERTNTALRCQNCSDRLCGKRKDLTIPTQQPLKLSKNQ